MEHVFLLGHINYYGIFCLSRILALEKLGAVFNQVSHPLQYTPRKFVIHTETSHLITIETDHNAYTEMSKAQRKQTLADVRALNYKTFAFDLPLKKKNVPPTEGVEGGSVDIGFGADPVGVCLASFPDFIF